MFFRFEALPCSGCFTTSMDEHFHAVGLDDVIWFSTCSRVSWLLWHSSRWVQCFSRFLQYMSGLEMLACTFDTNFDYVITMIQLCPSLNLWVVKLKQVLKGRQISELSFQLYFQRQIIPAVLFSLPKAPCWIFRSNA